MLNGADGTHNVMFTLALGVATLMVLENLLQRSLIQGFLWTLGMAGLASWLGVDYEWRGILVIVIFYLLKNMVTLSHIVEVCNFLHIYFDDVLWDNWHFISTFRDFSL